MDAAEEIFAERGYFGASLREVSARSGAALGLISHYFPSKEMLLHELVLRKLERLSQIVARSLEEAELTSGDISDLIDAFIRPFLRACVDQTNDMRNYIKLISHLMSTYQIPEINLALTQLIPISNLFMEHLRRCITDLSERNLRIAVYLIDAALIFMVQDTGFIQAVSDGQFTAETINELVHPAVNFFAGGVRALTTQT